MSYVEKEKKDWAPMHFIISKTYPYTSQLEFDIHAQRILQFTYQHQCLITFDAAPPILLNNLFK